jgi:hypothetical protein
VSLYQVELLLDVYNGLGGLIQAGTAYLLPSVPLTDTTDHLFVWQTPLPVSLLLPEGAPESWLPSVTLYSCDSTSFSQSGWTWKISFEAPAAPPPFGFVLDASPFSFTATHATPAVFTAVGSAYANGAMVVLSGGSVPAGFTAGTTYFVVSASGDTFELSATLGGSAIASTGTGSGTVATAASYLSSLTPAGG